MYLKVFYTPPHCGARLLDVGCGAGKFLIEASMRGWTAEGVDFSKTAIDRALKCGLRVHLGTLHEVGFADDLFDVVRMSHSLEHLYDPLSTLREVRRIVKADGKVHVAMPNASSLNARLFGRYWYPIEAPRHLFVFTAQNFAQLCERAGFRVVAQYQEADGKDLIGSLQYLLEDVFFLPSSCRGDGMRLNHELRTLLYVPAWFLSRIGLSDQIHYFVAPL
jgi:ubiquinone/menaquinone biosynthesis C-methylase UbiE